jgi:hypothetical protein
MPQIAEKILVQTKALSPIERIELIDKIYRTFDSENDRDIEKAWAEESSAASRNTGRGPPRRYPRRTSSGEPKRKNMKSVVFLKDARRNSTMRLNTINSIARTGFRILFPGRSCPASHREFPQAWPVLPGEGEDAQSHGFHTVCCT